MTTDHIRFNNPCTMGKEQLYIALAIADGRISGDGQFTRKRPIGKD